MGHPRRLPSLNMSGAWAGMAGIAGGWTGISRSMQALYLAILGFLVAEWSWHSSIFYMAAGSSQTEHSKGPRPELMAFSDPATEVRKRHFYFI